MSPPSVDSTALVTVGITCFNAEKTIERAVRSALRQSWSQLEIIVVDDASSDGSWQVISNMARFDARIQAVQHEANIGPAGARNTILAQASGEFIAFFDDDDESAPDRVRIQHAAIVAYEAAHCAPLVVCYGSGSRRYPNGYERQSDAIGSRPRVPKGTEVADYLLFNERVKGVFYGSGTPTCALMARLATLHKAGGFDNRLRRVEDVDIAVRLALAGAHFIGCPERIYLQNATLGSDKTPLKNLEAELQVIDKYSDYLRRKGRYDYSRRWFRLRYYHFSGQRIRFLMSLASLFVRYPLWVSKHLARSVPARWRHERKMRGVAGVQT